MSNKKIKKAFKEWSNVIIMVSIALAVALLIYFVDKNISRDWEKVFAQKGSKDEKEARETIPVEYGQFVDLMESYLKKHRESLEIGQPVFIKDQSITKIPISKGHVLLTGRNSRPNWCNDSLCFFHTEIKNDSVAVVSCPADLMARLVEDREY